MDQVPGLVERYFTSSAGELSIGHIPVSELANRYGTPLFIYDRSILDKKWQLLRNALPAEFSIYYSVKANPNQAILRFFLAKGAGLEIASGGEFVQALNAGCSPEKIIFAGPGKTESELQLVLKHGIGEIHVESPREAGRIAAIAERHGVRAPVALRVNPSSDAEGGAMRMGGRPAPFGVDEESLDEVLDHLLSHSAIEFRGVHLFAGTQILDFEILVTQYRKGIEIARHTAARVKHPLHTLDFGGGLGIPYFPHERELDVGKLRQALQALMEEVRGDSHLSSTQFLVEPGRYLVGEAGVYVVRVTDVKTSRGKKFLIVDGGMNHHLAASGNLGQTIKRNYPVAILNKLQQPSDEQVDVVGPLCTPLDVLARGVNLPRADAGDLIGVFQSGAYARSASPLGFLSHPTPAEVWVDRDLHGLIRRRGELSDYLLDQCLEQDLEGFRFGES
jgi:diaminopimelate decarboxylase